MDCYSPLLDRTRAPQPSIQRFAVISIFQNLRSAPSHLNAGSDAGKTAIYHCLNSKSVAVVDQSVRELCRFVTDGKMKVSDGVLELQAALEGCESRVVDVFVKGLGFLCRFAFKEDPSWTFESPETHPFVKILSCRTGTEAELVRQVLLFIVHNRWMGFNVVLKFLRPFVMFSILRIQFSSSSSSFTRHLLSSIASLFCSFPSEAMPAIKFLVGCLRYFSVKNDEEFKYLICIAEYVVDLYVVFLREVVGTGKLIDEAQEGGLELLETLLTLCSDVYNHCSGSELVIELSKRLLFTQKELGLSYRLEFVSVVTSLFVILTKVDFEHEQLSVLKLSFFLLKWKNENVHIMGRGASCVSEELLFVFPVLSLLSSPSVSVKAAATDLLSLLEKLLANLIDTPKKLMEKPERFPPMSKPESIICRLLHHLWLQDESSLSSSYLLFTFNGKYKHNSICCEPKTWLSQVRDYSLMAANRQKSEINSQPSEIILTGISSLLSALHSVLVMHPKVGTSAVDSLAAICRMDPKVSMPLLLAILFFNRYFAKNRSDSHVMLLKLMGVIPSLASHSVMMPLVLHTILPMLQRDAKPVLYATAVRVLCKTWEVTDRAFGSLQGVLQPKAFYEFVSERNICISMAASVRDVCKGSPDRGVDLILSVSACIESQDPTVQSLGFESLAHLCEADVVDFYTAWDVIAKPLANYSAHPIVAYSLCILLRWGAMDVEAYPETSKTIMQNLWDIATSRIDCSTLWVKARISALESLASYEVEHIQRSITDFNRGNLETLISEENLGVLGALERLEVKIITYEYMTRRRLLKEKRIPVNKVGKLLDVFPRVIFSSGKGVNVKDLPGAALLSLSFHSKSMHVQPSSKDLLKLHGGYVNALMEIADSLQLSRNIMIALLSLQSWKSFMHRWIRAISMDFNSLNINSEGANDILMSLLTTAEESLPQSVENIALAIGAFCMVLPPSAHAVTSSASKFLLKWLFQYEHEHRQWTSAISLGQMSSFLHATDSRQKFQIISGLLEVAANSKSTLVKGACGVGLGFTCQDLLTRVETGHKTHNSNLEEGSTVLREAVVVRKIVMALCAMISQLCPSSFDSLQRLCEDFEKDEDDIFTEEFSNMPFNNCDHLEVDVWGIAGLVLGLGNSVIAMYRTGAHDAVLKVKDMLISWIPHVNTLVQGAVCTEEGRQEVQLSVGSCLVLPTVVSLCQRAELIDHNLDNLIMGYKGLISELLDTTNKYGTLHQSLLMASCIGAGNLISSISTEGVYSMKADDVKSLLELMRNAYSHPNPPTIHLGGMIGVVNSMGAGAGVLTHLFPQPSTLETTHVQKESSLIRGPILSSPICEQLCTSLMQEMFLVAQDSKDCQIQKYAAWAVAFLRQRWWSNEFENVNSSISNAVETKPVSQNFAEDSLVWQISLWLMNLNISEAGMVPHVNTVTTVLRCLSQAPRLPALDWGAIVRRLMKYEDQVFTKLKPDPTLKKGALREGCIYFSVVHGNQVESLIFFLDEICDLSRFRTLELRLQSSLLLHLGKLRKNFSDSRLEKLFDDLLDYFSSPSSPYQANNAVDKSLLRVSLWNGLHECLAETSSSSLQYISNMEKCMELLFCLLPAVLCSNCPGLEETSSEKEWLEAVRCLGRARPGWLTDFLQVPLPEMDLLKGSHSIEIAKRIKAKARLVRTGCIPLSELGRLKPALLNTGFDGIWNVLLEVFAALNQAEGRIKRQWLLDAVEISCITEYPSPALQFLGLLSSSWCKYMPLLIVDRFSVLADLPVTLPSLLSDSSWRDIMETIIQNLWASMERIYAWAGHLDEGGEFLSAEPIHVSENSMSVFLRQVMYHTCFSLKDHLPFEKQLRLANMVVP